MATDLNRVQRIRVQHSGRLLPPPNSALGYLLIAIACWLFAGTIALLVISQVAWLASSDLSVDTAFHQVATNSAWLGDAALAWQYVGGPTVMLIVGLLGTVGLLVMRRPGWAGYLVACAVGGVLIAEVIKRTVGRARPTWDDPLFVETGGSFPSGHTMGGIYVLVVLGIICMYLIRRPIGTWIGWILVVIGVSMGPSRLILGVHWPSDVVVGWMLSIGWVLVVSAVALVWTYRRQTLEKKPAEGQEGPTA